MKKEISISRHLTVFPAIFVVFATLIPLSFRDVYALHIETFPYSNDSVQPVTVTAGLPVEFVVIQDAHDSSAIKKWRIDFNGDGSWDAPYMGRLYDIHNGDGTWWSYTPPTEYWMYEGYGADYRYIYPSSSLEQTYIARAEVELENGQKLFASSGIIVTPESPWPHNYSNHSPVADAGGTSIVDLGNGQAINAYLILPGTGLTLDGSASYDLDEQYGDCLRYWWNFGPNNTNIYTTNPTISLSPSDYPFLGTPGAGLISLKVIDRWGSYDTAVSFWDNTMLHPIPEPATLILFSVGLMGLAGVGRNSKKRRTHCCLK